VPIFSFPTLADPRTISFFRQFEPHLVHNVSALFVPKSLLEVTGGRVVGAHYADLPRLRGRDTIRWSILLGHPLRVTHMLLAPALDAGDVVCREDVDVVRGDDISTLRRKCQAKSAGGHLTVAAAVAEHRLEPSPQDLSAGSTFYEMGDFLRAKVDELLLTHRYSHVVEPLSTQ
jgi:methionyl-tRNA formyltransferase